MPGTTLFKFEVSGNAYEVGAPIPSHEAPIAKDVALALLPAMRETAKNLGSTEGEFMLGAALALLGMALSARNQKSAIEAARTACTAIFAQIIPDR